jgi:16S rRNA (cytidine1402-2'-O)-methyltransferase
VTLYVVATPIGNLQELSPRAREVLGSVDFVLCEDTRHSRRLFSAAGVPAPELISCHAHNEAHRLQFVTERLEAGASAALVTDAGTPVISDPGMQIIASLHQKGIEIHCVAGPSAVAAALSVSGFPAPPAHFLGFPPRKNKAREKWLIHASNLPGTVVIFESGRRTGILIEHLQNLLPDREACLCRELTKLHEEIVRGPVSDLPTDAQRGEVVLVLGPGEPFLQPKPRMETEKEIAEALGKNWSLTKREAYNLLMSIKPDASKD